MYCGMEEQVTIFKGNHYSNWWFPQPTFKRLLLGTVKFLGDFSYTISKQKDTNKLIGLSDNWNHHKDSIRIGWRFDMSSQRIEIMSIVYSGGKRSIEHLAWTQPEREYSFIVSVEKDYYLISFGSESKIVPRSSKWRLWMPRFILKPYFGGTTKAQKDFNFVFKL